MVMLRPKGKAAKISKEFVREIPPSPSSKTTSTSSSSNKSAKQSFVKGLKARQTRPEA